MDGYNGLTVLWMDGWMEHRWKSGFKDCLQQSKTSRREGLIKEKRYLTFTNTMLFSKMV